MSAARSKPGPKPGTYRHTEQARAKMSAKCAGRTLTQEHRDRISAGNRGKKRSADTVAKMRAAWKPRRGAFKGIEWWPEMVAAVRADDALGRSPRKIAEHVGVSVATLYRARSRGVFA